MKKNQRIISLLLTVIMVLSVCNIVPLTAAAAEANVAEEGDYPEIKVGDTVAVNIESGGDIAYLKFVPDNDMDIVFTSLSDSDTYGYLCDENMDTLESNDDGGSQNNFKITYSVKAVRLTF